MKALYTKLLGHWTSWAVAALTLPLAATTASSAPLTRATAASGTGLRYHHVRASKYLATLPTGSVGAAREEASVSTLSNLVLSTGAISPSFSAGTTGYALTVASSVNSIKLTPTASQLGETILVNGEAVVSGTASGEIALNTGPNTITVQVASQDGTAHTVYTVAVNRACAVQAITHNLHVVLGADGTATVTFAQVDNGSTGECGPLTYGVQRILGAVVNEGVGQALNLSTPPGLVFTDVVFANYGTSFYNSDSTFLLSGCHAANSQAVVEAALLGKNYGTVYSNSTAVQSNGAIFGDPCIGTSKNLTVQVSYTPEPQVVYTCADLGVNRVLLTVLDAYGNKSTAQAIVKVTQPPTMATTIWSGGTNTDWNDCRNWSYGQVPTASTNVVIPAGLPNYPIVSTSTQAINNLTLANGAGLTINNNSTLQVNGSWTNNGAATNLNGTVVFTGSLASQAINGSAATAFGTIQVNKASGNVELATGMNVSTALTMTSGLLTTGTANQITLGGGANITETETSYVIGNVSTTRTLSLGHLEAFGGLGVTLTPDLSSIAPGLTPVVRTTGTALSGVGSSQSIKRYYTIAPAIKTGLSVAMAFSYFEHELNNIPPANLRLFKSENGPSGPWANQSLLTIDLLGKVVIAVGITDFSTWTLGNSANPLPVELLSFAAAANGPAVRLAWSTASEQNSARFEVERSLDGTTFSRIGTVVAAGTSTGNHTYALTDASLPIGVATLYYRLRQVDLDGAFTYSPVRSVAVAAGSLALLPNPAHTSTVVAGAAVGSTIQVLDAMGRAVLTTVADATGAAQLSLVNVPSGVYIVRAGAQAARLVVN